jgi:hypothetical protein
MGTRPRPRQAAAAAAGGDGAWEARTGSRPKYEHYGGVLQEETTKETSILSMEMLLKEVFFHVTRRVVLEDDAQCPTNPDLLGGGDAACLAPAHADSSPVTVPLPLPQ